MSPVSRETPGGRAYNDLRNRARREARGTEELLVMYAIERWLARLASSPWADDFVLKGGMLLAAIGNRRHTLDVDALARNLDRDIGSVAARVREIAALTDPGNGGVVFDTSELHASNIRNSDQYSGVRVSFTAEIATARVKVSLDINFGDPVTPGPRAVELPSLRDGQAVVKLLGYPLETVIAEKLATAVSLGDASTRVRDWGDIYALSGHHDFDLASLRNALLATSRFRGASVTPLSEVINDIGSLRQKQYTDWLTAQGPDRAAYPPRFQDVVDAVVRFAEPITSGDEVIAVRWSSSVRGWGSAT